MTKEERVLEILKQAKKLAKEYRALTGRPLGVTSEIAEYEAVRLLGLELAEVRQPGYDAVRHMPEPCRLQIKGRCVRAAARSGRLGRIDLEKDWDAVLLVLLDEDLEAIAIYEAPRHKVTAALTKPGSRSRNERGALGVSQFKSIAAQVWHRDQTAP
jgi:hypothetical protein